jgi:cytidine deaminase
MSTNGGKDVHYNLHELVARAEEARERACATYSGFPVGCSIVLTDGSIVTGSSVEIASYGLTLCAERAAIAQVISTRDKSDRDIATVVVVGPAGRDCSPCGACRQWLKELAPDSTIYFYWQGEYIRSTPDELQPFGFELEPDVGFSGHWH